LLGFSEVQLHQFLEKGGFREIEVSVVSHEKQREDFQSAAARREKEIQALTATSKADAPPIPHIPRLRFVIP